MTRLLTAVTFAGAVARPVPASEAAGYQPWYRAFLAAHGGCEPRSWSGGTRNEFYMAWISDQRRAYASVAGLSTAGSRPWSDAETEAFTVWLGPHCQPPAPL